MVDKIKKTFNTVLIASDHGGYNLKEGIKSYLNGLKVDCWDMGTKEQESVDYPDFAHKLASLISKGEYRRGVLICGTGIGMSIVANRYKGVRGTLCHDTFTAQMAREHNDSNLLILGERVLNKENACEIVSIWLNTEFSQGRHKKRIEKIDF